MAKARLHFRPSTSLRSRRHGVTGTWSYSVRASVNGQQEVVLTDNTGGTASRIPAQLFDAAALDAALVTRLESAGHNFSQSWSDLVDGAGR